ncbi:major facilitator superfamily domain-containing protein [Cadophora sp. MPI-SDFR-AT-0126]|nr:major facilitator superfamily domain-containing protein [Leotiomycetes sp. MPI-SDFR-AT-0126]
MASQIPDPERDANSPQESSKSTRSHFDSSSDSSESIETYSERTSLLYQHGPDYKSTGTNSGEAESRYRNQDEDEEGKVLGEEQKGKSVFAIIGLLMIGVFMSNADGSLVMATYGTISSEFGALADASWLTTSYALATCAVQPITGKLSDIYGRKIVLLVSYVLFAVGSVICGIGQTMWQVIAGRVVAGLGAAGMTVIVSILITDLVPLIQVASWRSYVNVVATIGRSIGGPLGGFLADTVGWRWSFIGQGPIITLAIFLIALCLPSHTSPAVEPLAQSKPHSQGQRQPSRLHRVDFIGALLLASTIVSLLGALSLGGQSFAWSHPVVIGLGVASVVLGALFVVFEVYGALEPVFPPSLIIKRDVATAYGIITLQAAAQLAMMFSIPLYFRTTQNSSNTTAGSHLFPAVLGNTVGGLLSGLYISRTGHYKSLSLLAALSSSLCYLLLIIRWKGETGWWESLEIVPGGFGTGIAFSATFIGLTAGVEKGEMAVATSGLYLCSGLGMVVGVAGASAVQIGSLRGLLVRALEGVPESGSIIEEVISNVSSIASLSPPIRKIVIASYVKSIENSHALSLACSLAAFALACTIREHKLR